MTEMKNKKIEEEKLKRYLYAELGKKERKEFEEEFFLDDELFYEVVNLENQLVDRYVKGNLTGEELLKFEKSLEKFPERKQKVANSVALANYFADEKPPVLINETEPIVETFWQKLSDFFTIKSPMLGSAMAGLLVLFIVAGLLLFLDSRRKGEELARLQNERQGIEGVWQKRENELKEQLNNSSQRLDDLNNQLAGKDEDTEDFIKTLNAEKEKNQQLERDLEKLRQEINKPKPTPRSLGPTIASILLTPKGNSGGKFNTTSVGENTKKLAVNVALSDEVKKDELLSFDLNGQPFMKNVSPRVSVDGKKSINLTIPIKNLNVGENKLTIANQKGEKITDYTFNVDKPQD